MQIKKHFKLATYLAITVFLTLGLSISFQSLLASWQAPGSAPPSSTISAPINEGVNLQAKYGHLLLDGNASLNSPVLQLTNKHASENSFLVEDEAGDTSPFVIDKDGNVGIGKTVPVAKLDLAGNLNMNLNEIRSVSTITLYALPDDWMRLYTIDGNNSHIEWGDNADDKLVFSFNYWDPAHPELDKDALTLIANGNVEISNGNLMLSDSWISNDGENKGIRIVYKELKIYKAKREVYGQ